MFQLSGVHYKASGCVEVWARRWGLGLKGSSQNRIYHPRDRVSGFGLWVLGLGLTVQDLGYTLQFEGLTSYERLKPLTSCSTA